jgi:ribose transport system permease protein
MSTVTSAFSQATRSLHRFRIERAAFPVAALVLIIVGAVAYPGFRTVDNFRNILTFAAIPCIVALGQTVVVVGRGVDLSVGSMMALSGAIFGRLYLDGQNFWISFSTAIAIGVLLGMFVNGLLITKVKVSFIIVTLGTLAIFRSLATVLVSGNSLVIDSAVLDYLANGYIGPIPVVVVVAASIYIVALGLLRGTAYGRALYAVGSNPTAARLAGIPVDRVMIIGYGLCAGLAALAGLLTVGQLGSSQPTAGTGTELISIASVLLGGTRFSGGYGGVTGTVVGVLFLGLLLNLLLIAGVPSFWQGTVSGLVLIAAVAADRSRRD